MNLGAFSDPDARPEREAGDVDLDFAAYRSTVSVKGNLLHYDREYVVRQVEIPPAKVADFRRLESAILSDEKDSAVLKKQ